MRKTAVQLCLLILPIIACYGLPGSGAIMPLPGQFNSPEPATQGATCAPQDEIAIQTVGEIKVHFYCGITKEDKALISDYIRLALDVAPPGAVMKADVYVLDDLEQAARTKFNWLLAHGYPKSYPQVRDEIDSDCGETEPEALFFYLTKQCWSAGSAYPNKALILHEMHHLLQAELSQWSLHNFPAWLEEGGADAFAYRQLDTFDEARSHGVAPSIPCMFRLPDLEIRRDGATDACVYWEGQQAVEWLLQSFGPDKYYELLRRGASERVFSDNFLHTYGFTLGQFYPIFDQYRKWGYRTVPRPPDVVGTVNP